MRLPSTPCSTIEASHAISGVSGSAAADGAHVADLRRAYAGAGRGQQWEILLDDRRGLQIGMGAQCTDVNFRFFFTDIAQFLLQSGNIHNPLQLCPFRVFFVDLHHQIGSACQNTAFVAMLLEERTYLLDMIGSKIIKVKHKLLLSEIFCPAGQFPDLPDFPELCVRLHCRLRWRLLRPLPRSQVHRCSWSHRFRFHRCTQRC